MLLCLWSDPWLTDDWLLEQLHTLRDRGNLILESWSIARSGKIVSEEVNILVIKLWIKLFTDQGRLDSIQCIWLQKSISFIPWHPCLRWWVTPRVTWARPGQAHHYYISVLTTVVKNVILNVFHPGIFYTWHHAHSQTQTYCHNNAHVDIIKI